MKRVILADVDYGRVVRHHGCWGVVSRGDHKTAKKGKRVVDFWEHGRVFVSMWDVVEVES